jgi:hypothetical protein
MFVPKIASEEVVATKSKTFSEIDVEVKISKPDYFLSQSKSGFVLGLHTSITIHLTSRYPLDKIGGSAIFPKTQTDKYGPNLDEFVKR